MDSKKLADAIRTIRRELLIKDEPIKAHRLLEAVIKDLPELKEELERTKKMIRHLSDREEYLKVYSTSPSEDCADIEPEELIVHPGAKYYRYQWICDEIKHLQPETYADLACYVGTLPIWAASQGVKAYGVDLTKNTIAEAERRAENEKKEVEFIQDDLMNFKKGVDLVSAFEVLEHVPDDEAFIKHLLGLAKQWAYITTPNYSFGDGEGNLGHWDFGGGVRGHVRIYNENTLTDLIERCGGEVGDMFVKDGLLHAKFRKKK